MQAVASESRIPRSTANRRFAPPADWTGPVVYLYGTICALVATVVIYHGLSANAGTIDLNGFGYFSRNIALGKGFTFGFGPTMRRAPFYPLVAGAILKVFGNYQVGVPDYVTYRPVLIAQCFLFGVTCLTAWAIARRVFGPRVALLTAVLCPLFPESLRYIAMTEVEITAGFFAVLLAYLGLKLAERPRLSTGIWFGLAAAADTLTKPVTEFYVVVFLVALWAWWIWRARNAERTQSWGASVFTRGRVAVTCAALLVFALALTPWLVRNWSVTDGQFIGISSNAPGEFLRGYVNAQPKYYLLRQNFGGQGEAQGWDPEANNYEEQLLLPYSIPYYQVGAFHAGTYSVTPPFPTDVTSAQLEVQKDKIEGAIASARVRSDPIGFLGKFLIQMATYWYVVETIFKSLVVGITALVVLALAVLGIRYAHRKGVVTWPVVAVIVYLNVVYAATLALARYSMPLYPTLLALSAGGLASLAPLLAPLWVRLNPLAAPLAPLGQRLAPLATRLFPSLVTSAPVAVTERGNS